MSLTEDILAHLADGPANAATLAEQNGRERDTARARFGAGPGSTTSERTWNDADHA